MCRTGIFYSISVITTYVNDIFKRLYFAGCDFFFDGLVCWPSTPLGEEAGVNCWSIEAFARALGKNNKTGIHGKSGGRVVIFII